MNEEKGNNLVAWEVVTRPKEMGGLGMEGLLLRNKALLGKWCWRFSNERDSLWSRVICSKYELQENGWDAGLVVRMTLRSSWKYISQVCPDFLRVVEV